MTWNSRQAPYGLVLIWAEPSAIGASSIFLSDGGSFCNRNRLDNE